MKKVYIGIGHGGKDSGAVHENLVEKELNLVIGLQVKEELLKHDIDVRLSREEDVDANLAARIKDAKQMMPDLAIDIHNNAGGGKGAEFYIKTAPPYDVASTQLAKELEKAIKELGQNSRGLKVKKNTKGVDYFGFLREISSPSVIVECAFIDSTNRTFVDTVDKQREMGRAIAKAILTYLNIPIEEESTEAIKPLYTVQVGSYTVYNNAKKQVETLKAKGFSSFIVKK